MSILIKNIIEKYDPSMIVEASSGSYLMFWKVKDVPLYDFSNMQKAIAYHLKSNPQVTDLSELVPVPGYINLTKEPFLTEIIYMVDDDKFYSLHELSEMFPFK